MTYLQELHKSDITIGFQMIDDADIFAEDEKGATRRASCAGSAALLRSREARVSRG